MINLDDIYQSSAAPEKRLVNLLRLIAGISAMYDFATCIDDINWTLIFNGDAERKADYYSSPYQIRYKSIGVTSGGTVDVEAERIQTIEEDRSNLIFLNSSASCFNQIDSMESREILIRKYFLKEINSVITEAMLLSDRQLDRKIRIAKQDAIEAFDLDIFDDKGNLKNYFVIQRNRAIARKKCMAN